MNFMTDLQAVKAMAEAQADERKAENELLRDELSYRRRVQREAIWAKRERLFGRPVAQFTGSRIPGVSL